MVVQPKRLSENKLVVKDGKCEYWQQIDDQNSEHREENCWNVISFKLSSVHIAKTKIQAKTSRCRNYSRNGWFRFITDSALPSMFPRYAFVHPVFWQRSVLVNHSESHEQISRSLTVMAFFWVWAKLFCGSLAESARSCFRMRILSCESSVMYL